MDGSAFAFGAFLGAGFAFVFAAGLAGFLEYGFLVLAMLLVLIHYDVREGAAIRGGKNNGE